MKVQLPYSTFMTHRRTNQASRLTRLNVIGRRPYGMYLLVRHVQYGLQPVAVLLPGLFLVDLVPVGLRQPQEPPDGAQVLPQRAVLGARALFPAEELTEPTLVGR